MRKNIILIDGGMGQELIHRSKVKPDGLWSARVMLDNYDLVVDLHRDFIKAGAEVIGKGARGGGGKMINPIKS